MHASGTRRVVQTSSRRREARRRWPRCRSLPRSPSACASRPDRGRRASVADQRTVVNIDGREIGLSNLEKVLYPETGTTKAEVIEYYARIAPVMLPHLEGRCL